jgi:UDP-2,3-diacylglucosamine pyrophosphatase LpxH
MKKTKKRRFILLGLVLGILCGCNYLYQKIWGDKDKWRERTFKRMNEDLSGQVSSDKYLPRLPLVLNEDTKYTILSDLHRGDGGAIDYFNHNRNLLNFILSQIYQEGHSTKNTALIMLGDIEECWAYGFSLAHGNRHNYPLEDLNNLMHGQNPIDPNNVFYWEEKFHEEGNYYRIFGNHDDYWKNIDYVAGSLLDQNDIKVYPGIVFRLREDGEDKIFVTHGCQGQRLHDVGDSIPPLAKEAERVWYYLKRIFLKPGERLRYHTMEEARDNYNKQEQYLVEWAEEKGMYLITGHSHQPYINREKNVCMHTREINNIVARQIPEIEGKIRMLREEDVDIKEIFRGEISQEGKIDILGIHLKNKKLEAKFLMEEFESIRGQAIIEGDRSSLYFDDGCGFAANIISAIELVYEDDGMDGEGWYVHLVCWDIVDEERALLKTDTFDAIRGKTQKRILGSQKLDL